MRRSSRGPRALLVLLGLALPLPAAPVLALQAPARPTLAATNGELPSAREIINRHVEAVGGEAALMRVRSRYVWATYDYPARHARGTIELFAARPNKRVVKLVYPTIGTAVTGFDGTIGWTTPVGEPPRLIRGAELDQLRDQSAFDFDLHPDSLFRSIETIELADFEGRRCYVLRLTSQTGRQWTEYYDEKSGLFAGSRFPQETERGRVTAVTVMSRYQRFGSVLLPARLTIRSAGVEQNITVARVKENQVDESVFQPPRSLRGAAPE